MVKILYNQHIQVEPDPRTGSKAVNHIAANTIQFSKDTQTYVIENNITLKELKNLYKKYLVEKRINKIMETAQKKYSNHACNYCEYCTNNVNYLLKKFYVMDYQ